MTRTAGRNPGPEARRAAAGRVTPRYVTIVHSDIVASTDLVAAAGPCYPQLLARHRRLIAAAVRRLGGRFLSHAGDGTLAVFDEPLAALEAAVEAQRALGDEPWPSGLAPRVRMGVHAGEVYDLAGEPVGLPVHQGARIMALAAAGQVVVSDAVFEAVAAGAGPRLADAGWHAVRDHRGAVRLHQVVADGLTVVMPRREHLGIVA
jgi:class 3 adenylate cyclase